MYIKWEDMEIIPDKNDNLCYPFLYRFSEDLNAEQFFGSLFYVMQYEQENLKDILTNRKNSIFQTINDYQIRRPVLQWLQFIEDIYSGKRKISLNGQYTYSQAYLLYNMYDIKDQAIKDKLEANYLMGIMVSDNNLITCIDLWKCYLKGKKK